MEFDVILRNARVVDGTGAQPIRADVALREDRIEAVGDLSGATTLDDLDATGCILCPGFVDTHAHTDWAPFLPDEHQALKIANMLQGVTTEIPGNCGFSLFPAVPERLELMEARAQRLTGEAGRAFLSMADYRIALERTPYALNMAPLLGHGTLRAAGMGWEDREPTPDELARMERLVDEAMEQGAFGLSTGLGYSPGMFAKTDEIIALAKVAARHKRRYASHMRNETDNVEQSIEETLTIGREAGIGVHVSHHKVGMPRNWGKSKKTLAAIEAHQRAGHDVTVDAYPYDAGSTGLGAMLPRWAQEGVGISSRLRDPDDRARIVAALEPISMHYTATPRGHWERVRIAGFPEHPELEGRTIAEIADDRGTSDVDTVLDLLTINPSIVQITRGMDPAEVDTIISRPYAMVGSDGIPLPGKPHPRISGTFATVLHANAHDETKLVDAIRRMTGFPCKTFGIPDRGVVAEGKVADLVVFDPNAIAPLSTYDDPLARPSGVRHVIVGGKFTVRNGVDTGVRAGTVLSPAH